MHLTSNIAILKYKLMSATHNVTIGHEHDRIYTGFDSGPVFQHFVVLGFLFLLLYYCSVEFLFFCRSCSLLFWTFQIYFPVGFIMFTFSGLLQYQLFGFCLYVLFILLSSRCLYLIFSYLRFYFDGLVSCMCCVQCCFPLSCQLDYVHLCLFFPPVCPHSLITLCVYLSSQFYPVPCALFPCLLLLCCSLWIADNCNQTT